MAPSILSSWRWLRTPIVRKNGSLACIALRRFKFILGTLGDVLDIYIDLSHRICSHARSVYEDLYQRQCSKILIPRLERFSIPSSSSRSSPPHCPHCKPQVARDIRILIRLFSNHLLPLQRNITWNAQPMTILRGGRSLHPALNFWDM
jgi:hypothetical protein